MRRALPRRAAAAAAGLLLALGAAGASAAGTADAGVARGAYLARAGNCISCHTRPGGEPFAGGLAFETPLGTLHSTNITPDRETGIGGWSAADLRRAMREGVATDGSHLFPAFPYPAYTKLTDADIDAIHAWLQTLAPVRYTPPENGMLFALRWPLAIWKALFFTPGGYVPDPARSTEWNRGAYLVEGLGHCGSCHTPRNLFLAEQPELALQGGLMQAEVVPGKVRPWFAVNLTQSPNGLAAWSEADLVKYLHAGFSPRAGTFGPMNEVIVNSLRHLDAGDVRAMAVYLKSLPGSAHTGPTVSAAQAEAGAAIYAERCEKCHSRSGRGGFFSGPPVAGSAVVLGAHPASLINVLLYGAPVPAGVKLGAWETMPAYADTLDDAQIAALCNYLRGSWGHRASPVTAEQVRLQR